MAKKQKAVVASGFKEMLLYTTPNGQVNVEMFLQNETIWLTQQRIAELFGIERSVVTKHLKNIFETRELVQDSVCAIFAHTAADGKQYNTQFYNLDAIISVGYRVNSAQATHFRIWATRILKEYVIKGFAMDDQRLKNPDYVFGKDYFQEQLERIREIRNSERRFYQKITDIYCLAADYDKDAPETKEFFAEVQNKLHWAITGKTAAEIIYESADAEKLNMGLTTWKNSPDGNILKSDVTVAKNYLSAQHISQLNRIVSAYLDLAENRAEQHIATTMKEWAKFLNQFLELSSYPILRHKGTISALEAKIKAESEFEKYRITQDRLFQSDFDKFLKQLNNPNP